MRGLRFYIPQSFSTGIQLNWQESYQKEQRPFIIHNWMHVQGRNEYQGISFPLSNVISTCCIDVNPLWGYMVREDGYIGYRHLTSCSLKEHSLFMERGIFVLHRNKTDDRSYFFRTKYIAPHLFQGQIRWPTP